MNNKNSKRRLIPCPSEYTRLTGNHYHNEHQINSKTYFTHSTIHRMPRNATYTGTMHQCRAPPERGCMASQKTGPQSVGADTRHPRSRHLP